MRRFLPLLTILALLAATPALAAKKKSKEPPPPPPPGELKVGDWTCWQPPDFAKLTETQRRVQRSNAWQYLERLASGKLRSDFKFDVGEDYTYFETAFLGRPQLLDDWLTENLKRCTAVGEGKATPDSYREWLLAQGRALEAGECYRPLAYEYHNFMDIQADWQFRLHTCKGDQVLIETTGEENGKYTIADTGDFKKNKYITASGDPDAPQAGDAGVVAELPHGAVVLRFEAEDGSYTKYFLVGHKVEFESPDHGYVSFAVNDTTYFDNKFHDLKGAIDYLGIDIYPADTGDRTAPEGLP